MNEYLAEVRGVIHIGANVGQEIAEYAKYGLDVLWVEPVPTTFAQLQANLMEYPTQLAVCRLVTDVDGKEYDFHVASNNGTSSSIFNLKGHAEVLAWKDIYMSMDIKLTSVTLPTLLYEEMLSPKDYDALVVDTQGADLLVLKGAIPILSNFKFIQIEVADFEAYEGCCQLSDIEAFMHEHGYAEMSRFKFAWHPSGGSYFDIIYKKKH